MRRATPDDIPHIVRLGRDNYAAMNRDGAYCEASAAHFVGEVILKRGAAFVSDGGMIGGVLCPKWCAPAVCEALEMMWFARDGSGARLLRAWVDFARDCRAVPVITSRKLPPRLAASLGLAPSEIVWRGADVP